MKGGGKVMAHGFAKIIEYLPDGLAGFLARKIVNGYISKYANIIVEGKENLEEIKRPVLFISNHLSNSDALVLNEVLKDEDVTFVAGVKLSQNSFTNLGRYLVKTLTIKPNSADKDAISNMVKTLKNGSSMHIFPEGTRSRTASMIEGKRGIVLIQKLAKVDIVPVGIYGSENLMPINMDGKMGSEKFYHADVHVKIGKAVEIPKKNIDESKHQYEHRVMNVIMTNLAYTLPEKYRGVYKVDK